MAAVEFVELKIGQVNYDRTWTCDYCSEDAVVAVPVLASNDARYHDTVGMLRVCTRCLCAMVR